MLGVIFKGAPLRDPQPGTAESNSSSNLIDQVDWLSLPVDVKGTIYEELLSRSAQESSRGAGQYFTPRPVIQAMCEVMQPAPEDRICDPAAGTGGFLCNAYQYVLNRHEKRTRPRRDCGPCKPIWWRAWRSHPRSAACAP